MRGLADSMPARRSWTIDSVLEALKDEPLSVMQSSTEFFSGAANQHTTITCTPSHLLHHQTTGQHLYLAQHPLLAGSQRQSTSPLLADAPRPLLPHSLMPPDIPLTSVNLWLCMGPVRSSLHYDSDDNCLCIIRGSKHITLYPPHCTPWLYPRSVADDGSVNHSTIDLSQSDHSIQTSHPLFRFAQKHKREITAQEGDGIFIPAGGFNPT